MIEKELYGIASLHGNKGRKVSKYTLSSEGSSVTAVLCDYGARILDIKVRMPDGSVRSAVLGHPSLGVYEKAPGYLGALVGRTGNRTAGGRFSLKRHNPQYKSTSCLLLQTSGHCNHKRLRFPYL